MILNITDDDELREIVQDFDEIELDDLLEGFKQFVSTIEDRNHELFENESEMRLNNE